MTRAALALTMGVALACATPPRVLRGASCMRVARFTDAARGCFAHHGVPLEQFVPSAPPSERMETTFRAALAQAAPDVERDDARCVELTVEVEDAHACVAEKWLDLADAATLRVCVIGGARIDSAHGSAPFEVAGCAVYERGDDATENTARRNAALEAAADDAARALVVRVLGP